MIIVRLRGGMGNQMFQYALGRALALKYNVQLKLDAREYKNKRSLIKREYALDLFNIKAEIASKKEIFWRKLNYKKGKEKYFHFDPKILLSGRNVYLNGYWQSPKYFAEIEEIIKKDFTFKQEFPENIKILMKEIKENNSLCVHVRRGDYVGNRHHEVVNKEYYDQGLEYLKNKTKIDKIYLFSDDIKWCEKNIKFDFPTMFVGDEYAGEKAEGHMALMSTCHYFIIPNSSFAWWAAWLANYSQKIIVAPLRWLNKESINSKDIIPQSWCCIDVKKMPIRNIKRKNFNKYFNLRKYYYFFLSLLKKLAVSISGTMEAGGERAHLLLKYKIFLDPSEKCHLARYNFAANLIKKGSIVADFACGTGYGSALLALKAEKVFGLDIAEEVIEKIKNIYKKHKNIEFVCEDILNIKYKNAFDYIISFETLEHFNESNIIKILNCFKEALKPGGVLIFSAPYLQKKSEEAIRMGFHKTFNIDENKIKSWLDLTELYLDSFRYQDFSTSIISNTLLQDDINDSIVITIATK